MSREDRIRENPMNKEIVGFDFLDAYAPMWDRKYTYYIISGGRGSGKTTNVVGYILLQLLTAKYCRCAISRYTQKALQKSIYQDMLDIINNMGMSSQFNISGNEIVCKHNNNKVITHSLKLADGSMDSNGKGLAGITHLIIDEATEVKFESEYIKLTDTIRGVGDELKIFVMFNPGAKSHWIHQRFFIDGEPNPKWFSNHCFIHTTFRENKFLNPTKAKEYADYEIIEPHRYRYEIEGHWKDYVEGRIYDNWHFDYEPPDDSEVFYGLDFGYSNDPAALIRVHRRGRHLWLKELIYETGKTNLDLVEIMESLGVPKDANIIADSAEGKSIEEIRRKGYRNIKPCKKGNGSIAAGITRVAAYEIHVDPSSSNLIAEYQNYAWRNGTDNPMDSWNHLLDALRYSISLDKNTVTRYSISGIKR